MNPRFQFYFYPWALCLVIITLHSCKSISKASDDHSELRIANAPDTSTFLNSLTPERRAAASQLLSATALIRIMRKDGSGDYEYCSGTIVSKRHVVLAAHCFRTRDEKNLEDPSNIAIYILVRNSLFPARLTFIDPGYNPAALLQQPDIAIVQVQSNMDLTLSGAIVPVAIASQKLRINFPSESDPNAAKHLEKGFVAGYGSVRWNQNVGSENLRIKPIEFAEDNFERPELYQIQINTEGANAATTDNDLARAGGVICHGDSGGPSVVVRGGKPILLGVTSHAKNCEREIAYSATDVRKIHDLESKFGGLASFSDGITVANPSSANSHPERPLPSPQTQPVPHQNSARQVCVFRSSTDGDALAIEECREGLANSWPGKEFAGIRYRPHVVQGVLCNYECLMYGPGDPNDYDICFR